MLNELKADELDKVIVRANILLEKKRKEELARKQKEIERQQEELRKREEKLRREREEAEREAARKAEEAKSQKYIMDNDEASLAGDFAANKGKLPFPMSGKCRIVKHFGRQKYGDLAHVETYCLGIDIEGSAGATARAAFRGRVSAIFMEPTYGYIVMLRHGSYLTVYCGLETIDVKSGQEVKTGQSLGHIAADPDDASIGVLHFEVRHEREKLNPEEWIRLK